jgi:hypothetical protein
MKKISKTIAVALLFFSMAAQAQGGPGDESDQGNLEEADAPPTPIGGNLFLLAAAGTAAAFYALQRRKPARP